MGKEGHLQGISVTQRLVPADEGVVTRSEYRSDGISVRHCTHPLW